jgi:CRISPR-associated protein Cas5h
MLDLLVFDVSGYMGHFRKVYSTTSSLSYMFPPRTAIMGLVASILGLDRDSYYDDFAPEHCRIAVGLRGPVRKLVQKILYLNTDTLDEYHLRGTYSKEPRVPIAVEMLVPEPPQPQLGYRIYLHHAADETMSVLAGRLASRRFSYPVSLGLTGCLATVTLVDRVAAEFITSKQSLPIRTVIPQSKLAEMNPKPDRRVHVEDRVPVSFDSTRHIRRIENFVFEGKGQPLDASIHGELFKCQVKGEGDIYGVFMD